MLTSHRGQSTYHLNADSRVGREGGLPKCAEQSRLSDGQHDGLACERQEFVPGLISFCLFVVRATCPMELVSQSNRNRCSAEATHMYVRPEGYDDVAGAFPGTSGGSWVHNALATWAVMNVSNLGTLGCADATNYKQAFRCRTLEQIQATCQGKADIGR
jgi:hypothetical protein